MPKSIRAFNQAGRIKWANYIDSLKHDPTIAIPQELFQDSAFLTTLPIDTQIDQQEFSSKFELAEYLYTHVKEIEDARIDQSTWPGVWEWLAAYFFDNLAPLKNGKRSIGEKARYVYNPAWNRRYRHRIAGPCGLYNRHQNSSQIFLYGQPSTLSDMEEQASARQAMSSNSHVAQALMSLYWDESKQRPKNKAADTKRSPGSLRRFSDILLQLERTYDLDSIQYEGIISLLPQREFQKWLA